jgi:hypothetical protein
MDPITMAAATAAGLFAKKLLEEVGSQAGKSLSAATGKLVAWVRRRGAEDTETEDVPRSVELWWRPVGDQAASSLVGVASVAIVWSSAARRAGRYR